MRVLIISLFLVRTAAAQEVQMPLAVEAGVPLRLYLTQRLPMKIEGTAKAKLIEPLYVFDRIVIPAGSEVQGHVTALDKVGKLIRTQALLGGDFTPLHRARVEFTGVTLPNGQVLALRTTSTVGLPTLYTEPKPPKPRKKGQNPPASSNRALHEAVTREINAQIDAQLNSKTYGLGNLVRGPNKMERLEDFVYAKLPYHPQRYRRGTRFDAVLEQPLDFGRATISAAAISEVGTEASFDRAVEVRFLSAVSSTTAKTGDPVEAALSEPLLSSENKLILPEGTRLAGTVRQARPARWFHRSGKLRFNFDRLTLPPAIASLPQEPVAAPEARLVSAETDPAARVKIDSEGAARATTSKTQLLAPAIAALIAVKSMDNDYGKATSAGGNGSGNAGGLALGGFSGFGLVGVAAARVSVTAGSALGMWGLAMSAYNTIVSRGPEVKFDKNASMVLRFGSRPKPSAPTQ